MSETSEPQAVPPGGEALHDAREVVAVAEELKRSGGNADLCLQLAAGLVSAAQHRHNLHAGPGHFGMESATRAIR